MKHLLASITMLLVIVSCTKDHPQPPPIIPPTPNNLIVLRFDGYKQYAASGLSKESQDSVLKAVQDVYKHFDLTITTDTMTIYTLRRQDVVLTIDNEWYDTHVGGMSVVGSLKKGVPNFIFTKALKFSTDRTIYTTVHEIGHALGLLHQMQYDSITCEYGGYTKNAWMGLVAYGQRGSWIVGTREHGCGSPLQHDSLDMVAFLKP